jgi:hypothetical protein
MAHYCKIDTELVKINENWNISQNTEVRSLFNCTVTSLENLSAIYLGSIIQMYDHDDNLLFEGLVTNIKDYSPFEHDETIYYALVCNDYTKLAEKRLVASVETNEKVEDIVTNTIIPILTEEGISSGTIDCDITITKAIFSYVSCSEALDMLADLVDGYIWYIDTSLQLHFINKIDNISTVTVNSSFKHTEFERNKSLDTYRNTQYIWGGKARTDTQTDEVPAPTPDGAIKKYYTRYPIAEEPTITVNSVAVNSDDVGINGIDTDMKWYWTYGTNQIVHDDAEVALDAGLADTLEITYIGLRNLLILTNSPDEIDSRALIEGNSGKYENIYKETQIDNTTQAIEYGNSLLKKYGEIKDTVNFKTKTIGIEAGQLLRIVKTAYDIDDYFLVRAVTMTQYTQTEIEYSVECLDGAAVGGWERYFLELIKSSKDYSINDTDVLIIALNLNEKIKDSGQTTIYTYDILYMSDTLLMSDTLTMGSLASTEVIDD